MSADPRLNKTLARFSVLVADATLLINRNTRPEPMVDSLLNALQLFKENRLGGIYLEETPKTTVETNPLNMTVAAFFSIQRFIDAGVPHRHHRRRILSAVTNVGTWRHDDQELPHTVQDLINLGEGWLKRRRHLGSKSIEIMYTLFKYENLV